MACTNIWLLAACALLIAPPSRAAPAAHSNARRSYYDLCFDAAKAHQIQNHIRARPKSAAAANILTMVAQASQQKQPWWSCDNGCMHQTVSNNNNNNQSL
jgi:hypothetical protein